MAGAYGLQSFDSEENTQTRDFLLTKPLNISWISGAKYFPGLMMLLVFNFFWQMTLQPASLRWPDIFDLTSLWFTSFSVILVCIYSVSFVTGLLIAGPQKLFFALIVAFAMAGWLFEGWCEGITACYFAGLGFQSGFVSTLLTLILSGGIAAITILCGVHLAGWRLSNTIDPQYRNQWLTGLGLLLFLPVLLWLNNAVHPPAIRPFNQLALSFFEKEPWFITIRGFRQPNGPNFACIDTIGRIALSQGLAKPRIIIRPKSKVKTTQITWSGDGKFFSYDANGFIQTYELSTGKIATLTRGDQAFWSHDNTRLLVSQLLRTQYPKQSNRSTVPHYTMKFTLFDRLQKTPISSIQFNSLPTRAFEWNSGRHQLLAVDPSWSLKIINLLQKKVQTVNFLTTLKKYEIITWCQIIHTQIQPSRFDLVIASIDEKIYTQRRNRINLRWYTFDPDTSKIRLNLTFPGLKATEADLVLDAGGHRLLSNNGSGVYYPIKLEGGQSK